MDVLSLGPEANRKNQGLKTWDDLSRSSLGSLSLLAQPTHSSPGGGAQASYGSTAENHHSHCQQQLPQQGSPSSPLHHIGDNDTSALLGSSPPALNLPPTKDWHLYQNPRPIHQTRSEPSRSPRHRRVISSPPSWTFFGLSPHLPMGRSFGQSSLSVMDGQPPVAACDHQKEGAGSPLCQSCSVLRDILPNHRSLLLPRTSPPAAIFGHAPRALSKVFSYLDRKALVAWGSASVWCARSIALAYPRYPSFSCSHNPHGIPMPMGLSPTLHYLQQGASAGGGRSSFQPGPGSFTGSTTGAGLQCQWPSYPMLTQADSGKFTINIEMPIPRSSSHSSFLQTARESRRQTLAMYIIVTEVALALGATVLGAFGAGMLDNETTIAMCFFGIAIGMGIVAIALLIWWCLNTREYNRQYIYRSW
eukprot:CAMPEP_0117770182 /NCGR_PEP_ID=MMETSP0947-20121206/23600_1 /TAXON_ID=44440 /ORGANISM="Chattonella subsalsa, Strain CCMP2191" /LENGTH=417 /DNA_ID=CAMNT_0005595069 /DNA_START=210 /DNA_END=1463 /DNA_ORIENTATION=+